MVRSLAISSANWRTQITQTQLLHQISTILLQRKNWQQLLHLNQNLTSNLNPSLFSQIIRKTRTNPQISIDFFNWVKSNLNFHPDLNSQCQILTICVTSSSPHRRHIIPALDSLIQTHSCPAILDAVANACEGKSSDYSNVLSFVCEYFGRRGRFKEGLLVFRRMRACGLVPSVNGCNAIIECLRREDEIRLVWCFYGVMIRRCVEPVTWSLLAPVLSKGGSFDRIAKVVDVGGVSSSAMYNALVDCCSKNGDFDAAFDRVTEMLERGIVPGFGTYASILDGACRLGNVEVIERVVGIIMPEGSNPVYDEVIHKLCGLAKTNAALMFFCKARDENVRFQDSTYSSVLRTLSEEGRLEDAIRVYRMVEEKGIESVKNNAYRAFVDLLCEEERYELLTTVLENGFRPCTRTNAAISRFVASQCEKREWTQAERVLDLLLENGSLPDPSCLSCLVRHYCSSGRIDKAVSLHSKVEKLEGRLDVSTCNILLDGLVRERRVAEAVKMFDFMKGFGLVDSESYVTVVRVLCRGKEMRKAMQVHDEMLQMGMKPAAAVYKKLILGFQ